MSRARGLARFGIEYAVVCHRGFLREKNQDNFWCGGAYLECENNGLPNMLVGVADSVSRPAFAVFDGLGGETAGELASWLAARTFDDAIPFRYEKEEGLFLKDVFGRMNNSISEYADSQHIGNMGTTGAAIIFGEDSVSVCSLGDSSIYLHRDGKLVKLSEDHVAGSGRTGRPCLTQFLGIPEKEFCIEPFFARREIHAGDRFLLCSDGLTDMLPDKQIEAELSSSGNPARAAEGLLAGALGEGGKDNITLVICDVGGEKR